MTKKILMTPADFFGIEYEINAWMHAENQVDRTAAQQQWRNVHDIYTKQLGWQVELATPVEHLPDMVFATDCCLMLDGKILLSNFRYPERQPETARFEEWFRAHGYTQMQQAKHRFEGGGDNLVCGDKILAGHGFRSDSAAADELREYFGREVVPLKIIDPFFYHLDTSLAVLSDDTVAFYPGALDQDSQARLRAVIPNVIEATLEEARGFGLNAVSDGHTIITSNESESLLQRYRDAGFEVIGTPILEFRKSGGGVKCMTLELRD
ncbi:MAG TPA: arginine deiminase family protein [Candidatus Saccharimonadales bacterium]|nr:arginine deiminase family protein [Candidatus Saccharimonadales bacterium]